MYNNYNYPQNNRPDCPQHTHDYHDSCPGQVLAMAYVPWQHFDQVYDLPMALQTGTIFPELNKPFRGSRGGMKCSCRQ